MCYVRFIFNAKGLFFSPFFAFSLKVKLYSKCCIYSIWYLSLKEADILILCVHKYILTIC